MWVSKFAALVTGGVGTWAISDRGCVSIGSLTIKPWDRIYIGLIKQSNAHSGARWPQVYGKGGTGHLEREETPGP